MDKLTVILDKLDMPLSKIETELDISNGLLGKIKKGDRNLSEDVWNKLLAFYEKTKGEKFVFIEKIDEKAINKNVETKEQNGNSHKEVEEKSIPIQKPKMTNQEKLKNLRLTIDKIDKDFGKGNVMFMEGNPDIPTEVISTGSIGLDKALGIGGLPKGRIVEIYGPESSGKTTLAIHVIREAQKNGEICAFVDAEHAFDKEYAKAIGVDTEALLISQPDYGEQALEIADRLIVSGSIGVIVIDSVAALVPKAEIEGEMGDSKLGLQARLMSQACRKLTSTISKTNTICIFINQLRSKIGVIMGNPEVTTGGNALKFYSSIRLDVRKTTVMKDGEESYGNKVRVKVVKNKCAPPFRQTEFDIIYGKGIDRVGEILDVAVETNIIQKSGSWFSYDGNKLGQGRDAVRDLLSDNENLLKEIEQKLS